MAMYPVLTFGAIVQQLQGSRLLSDGTSVWTADEFRQCAPYYVGSDEVAGTPAYLAPEGIYQQRFPWEDFTLWLYWID